MTARPHPSPLVAQTRISTPLGALTLATTARGLALAWFDGQAHRSETVDAPDDAEHPHLQLAARELQRYWHIPQLAFTVPLDPRGTPFQHAVWQVLRGIEAGALLSYGAVAQALGKPQAVRSGGRGHRAQPAEHRRALPPRGGGRRRAHGLCRRPAAQTGLLVLEGAMAATASAVAASPRAAVRA